MNNLKPKRLKLEDFNYQDDRIYKEIHSCMNQMSFAGVSVCSFHGIYSEKEFINYKFIRDELCSAPKVTE